MTTFFTQGGTPDSSDGDERKKFLGFEIFDSGICWVEKFGKYFLGWLDFCRDFFLAYSKLSDLILHNVMKQKMFLGVSSLRKFGMEFFFFWGGGGVGGGRFSPGVFRFCWKP